MYYPVAVDGGLLSLGDSHAAQGDSELAGTAIEMSLTGVIQVVVHKAEDLSGTDLEDLSYPLLETQDVWVVHGFSYANYLAELGEKAQQEIYSQSSVVCPLFIRPPRESSHFEVEVHNVESMIALLRTIAHGLLSSFRDRASLQLEIMALRHQLEELNRRNHGRVRLTPLDRAFWTLLYRLWSGCLDAVVIVKPDTVVRWHRKGFRLYWTWKSKPRGRGRRDYQEFGA